MGWSIVNTSGAACGLDTFYRFTVQQALGAGMPPVSNVTTEYGLLDGTLFQRTRAEERTFTLVGTLSGSDVRDLHHRRRVIIDAVKPDRTSPQQAVVFRYDGGGTTVQASAYYAGGLELGNVAAVHEANVGLQFTMADPYWEATTSTACDLAVTAAIANVTKILQRDTSGSWRTLGAGIGDSNTAGVKDIAEDSASNLYFVGNFTQAGGVTSCGLAKWNGSAWTACSVAGSINTLDMYTVAVGPDDSVYIGGNFASVGGISSCAFMKWTGAAWTDLGASPRNTSGDVTLRGIAFTRAGHVVIVGNFLNCAGAGACGISVYNGSSWSTPGTNGACPTDVRAVAVAPNDDIWVAGAFTHVDGVAACGVAYWDGTAWNYPDGASGIGQSLAITPDGTVYLGGGNASLIQAWNGAVWQAVDGGLNAAPQKMKATSDGQVYAGGVNLSQTAIGGYRWPSSVARFNGSVWSLGAATYVPGVAGIWEGVNVHDDGRLTVGYHDGASSAGSVAGITTVTNNGTAKAYPLWSASGAGAGAASVYQLVNFTTGQEILFNLNVSAGEVVTLDLRTGRKTLTSNFRGNIIDAVLPNSDLSDWHLAPGANKVSCFILGGGRAELTWANRYWSLDAGA